MKFSDFVSTQKSMAMAITVGEYMSIKPLLQEIYSIKDIEHIDDFCQFKPYSERFLLCNPAEQKKIITPMMLLSAVTFIDRVPFKNIDFSDAVIGEKTPQSEQSQGAEAGTANRTDVKDSNPRPEPENQNSRTGELVEEVEMLHNNTPSGMIMDADTILLDLIDQCDFEFSGLAQDIFDTWKASIDKKAVERMFYLFTDMEFEKYLSKCKEEITRKPDFDVRSQLSDQMQAASARAANTKPVSPVKEREPETEI